MFKDLKNAVSWLESQRSNNREMRFNNLDEAIHLLKLNKVKKIKKVHIAGTNGKGSTTAFLSNIATRHKLKVGMFVSPYILTFNERMQINNIPISNSNLLDLINYIYKFQQKMSKKEVSYSFFELSFLIALKYFIMKDIDLMLIEVGIGGLLDTTNVLTYDLSIITNIGLDHQSLLGNSLNEILIQKLGILKPKGTLITTIQPEFINEVKTYCKTNNINYTWINPEQIQIVNTSPYIINFNNNDYELSLIGNHQKQNAILAVEAFKYLYNTNYDLIIKEAIKNTKWPGRMEEVISNVYLDGAHNINGIEALTKTINTFFNKKDIYIIYSSLKGKDYELMLLELSKVAKQIVVTSFPDFRYESLAETTKINNKIEFRKNLIDNFNDYLKGIDLTNSIIIITGSLHFIGYAKKVIEGDRNDY